MLGAYLQANRDHVPLGNREDVPPGSKPGPGSRVVTAAAFVAAAILFARLK